VDRRIAAIEEVPPESDSENEEKTNNSAQINS
jgi:hypothetical protein